MSSTFQHLIGGNTISLPKQQKEKDRAIIRFNTKGDNNDLTIDAIFKQPTLIVSKEWVRGNIDKIIEWSNS